MRKRGRNQARIHGGGRNRARIHGGSIRGQCYPSNVPRKICFKNAI